MGYRLAGMSCRGFAEVDPRMAQLYKLNLGTDGVVGDIRELVRDPSKIPASWAGVDIVDGSPPCTVFSSSRTLKTRNETKSYAEGVVSQRLDDLFLWFIRFVGIVRPRLFVAENVIGMKQRRLAHFLTQISNLAAQNGYCLRVFQLCATAHGCPQLRRRLFFVGAKDRSASIAITPSRRPCTVGAALKGLVDSGAGKKRLTPKQEREWHRTPLGARVKGASFTGIKLNPNRTTGALVAGRMGPFHWMEPRMLSYAECARLQTFPDDYNFGEQCGQYVCGMSVPPFVAHDVGTALTRALE